MYNTRKIHAQALMNRTVPLGFRMSPTEFSNYIKQRAAMQQQIHHHHHHQQQQQQQQPPHQQPPQQQPPQQQQQQVTAAGAAGLPVSQSSPRSRSLSPGSIVAATGAAQQHTDPSAYFFQHGPAAAAAAAAYHAQFPHRNIFDSSNHGGYLPADLYAGAKFPSSYLDPTALAGHQFYGGGMNGTGAAGTNGTVNGTGTNGATQSAGSNLGPIGSTTTNANAAAQQQQDKNALVEGLNNFGLGSVAPYPASQYQHLLVAN